MPASEVSGITLIQRNKYGLWKGVGGRLGQGSGVSSMSARALERKMQMLDNRSVQSSPQSAESSLTFTDGTLESQGCPETQRDSASLNRALKLPPPHTYWYTEEEK